MFISKNFAPALLLFLLSSAALAQDKPNIVLVFMDNFGWGEPGFNGGGIIRGAATPRLDQIARQGLRLTNFNVEVQCTPSRSALMTGRYAIRSGNGTVPLGEGVYGHDYEAQDFTQIAPPPRHPSQLTGSQPVLPAGAPQPAHRGGAGQHSSIHPCAVRPS